MDQTSRLVGQLNSPDKNKRYDACELLRVSPTLPPEAISALQVATHDSEGEVAEAAQRALAIHLASASEPRQAPLSVWTISPLDLSEERLSAIVRQFRTRLRWYFAAVSVAIPSFVGLMVSIRNCLSDFSAAEGPTVVLCAPFLSCAAPFLGLPAPAWLVLLAVAAAVARLNLRCPNCGRSPRNVLTLESCASCRVPLKPESLRDYIDFMRGQGGT